MWISYMKKLSLKNITLSADASLIENARKRSTDLGTTLNQAFREWLEEFTRPATTRQEYNSLMKRLSGAQPGRKFSREEMNER
jgi:hypothetical protein